MFEDTWTGQFVSYSVVGLDPDFYLRRFSESLSRVLSPFEVLFPAPWFPVESLRDQPICSFAPPLHLEAACLLLFKTSVF